jgi:putative ABC transport system permease protein
MKRLGPRLRAAWRVLWRSHQLESDMQDEMRFHVEMEAERLVREHGIDPREARRLAYVRFGGVEKYKEAGRDARGRQWLDAISLDTRLGVRMLVKHRGLTFVGGFAMAVAIAIGATFFEVIGEMLTPALPFADGERVVAVEFATANPGSPERRVLRDFAAWREEVKTIEHLGAFRTTQHNLVSATVAPEPVKVAEMTAAGFAIGQTPVLLGRYLLASDEPEGAPSVLVISYQAWQSRFGADPQIVGRTINLGGVPHSIVGVMPDGFHFPYDHHLWIPLRANPLKYERLQGPSLYVFGRLARGVTIEQAQAELTTIAQRAPGASVEPHERLQPRVIPYTRAHVDLTHPTLVLIVRIAQLLVGALSFVVAVNLAILVYARTVTRLGEIAVRTALGASRRRILTQLFIEAFALSMLGAGFGLALAYLALDGIQWLARANGGVPFWIRVELSLPTVIYALALAAFAAVIMGVLPGLKATGRRVAVNLHELNGRAGTRLGPLWTTLVVAQLAVAVAVLPLAVYLSWQVAQFELAGPGFAAEQFVVASLVLSDDPSSATPARVERRQRELAARLQSEPGVTAVTFSSSVPGFAGDGRIEFDASTLPGASDQGDVETEDVSVNYVALDLFDVYDAEIRAGRPFNAADLGAAHTVIVNDTFVGKLLKNRSPLGVRFRYLRSSASEAAAEAPRPAYQIVGVVRDFPRFPPTFSTNREPVVYHPAAPGAVHPLMFSVRFAGSVPAGVIERIRAIGAEIDPALQLRRVVPLSRFYDDLRFFWRYVAWGIGLVTASVLLLSAAGIYALMSFTVAQRTREIGIRMALGAQPRRILFNVFARAVRQLTLGVLAGSLVSGALLSYAGLGLAGAAALLLTVAAIMLIVGLAAAFGPARRGIQITASEALRADA